MKSLLLLGAGLFWPLWICAQFDPVIFIDTVFQKTIRQLEVADINHDGKLDIIAANKQWPNDHLTYYVQEDEETYTRFDIPTADSLRNLEHFAVGEIIPSGGAELVVAYDFPWKISLFSRQGDVYQETVIDDSLDLTQQVILADFNQDGWTDILSLQHVEIVLYLALAPGVFDEGRVIYAGTEFYAIDAGYYNADSLLDVAIASDGFDILLYQGQNQFSVIESPHIGLTFHLQSADLDRDGDTDIAAYEALRGILFYSNDGEGHFTLQDTILASSDVFDAYVLSDMDCDEDVDVYTSVAQPGWVIWIENDGQGHFPVYHELHFQAGELIRAVALGDLDANGSTDPVWGNKILGARLNRCMPVGVSDARGDLMRFRICPNPAASNIHMLNETDMSLTCQVFDLTGRPVSAVFQIDSGETRDIEMADSGLYVVRIQDEYGMTETRKAVVAGR